MDDEDRKLIWFLRFGNDKLDYGDVSADVRDLMLKAADRLEELTQEEPREPRLEWLWSEHRVLMSDLERRVEVLEALAHG
jgi:hypothetical protein